MSQEKVDYKKSLKGNRKKINQQRKRNRMLGTLLAVVIVAAVVVWIGYSVRGKQLAAKADAPVNKTTVDITAITEYMAGADADVE